MLIRRTPNTAPTPIRISRVNMAISPYAHGSNGQLPQSFGHMEQSSLPSASSQTPSPHTKYRNEHGSHKNVLKNKCFINIYRRIVPVQRKRKKSDSVPWKKTLHQQKCQKGKVTTKTTPQKSLISQRLRTDLGRSVGVTTATQLVWFTGFTGPTFPLTAIANAELKEQMHCCCCTWYRVPQRTLEIRSVIRCRKGCKGHLCG